MLKNKTYNKKKVFVVFALCFLALLGLGGRLAYLMIFQSEYYEEKAQQLHERERDIKAARGKIVDATGTVLATNKTVCTISVIHSQIEDPEAIIAMLMAELELDEETARKRVETNSSIERVKTNVDKEVGDQIRSYDLAGVKVDEDYKRYYPFGTLASKVLGFTGSDNQGIIGLEVEYDEVLQGTDGKILTTTDARGIELEGEGESRLEAIAGNDLHISLDNNVQQYVEQSALKVMDEKGADSVSIFLMNPQDGEIIAMVNVPEFDLNDPYTLNFDVDMDTLTDEEYQNELNQMWRNQSISDTYEPGSTFKIMTAAAALEEGVVSMNDHFNCPGYIVVGDRRIRCHKTTGHGPEDFLQAAKNSCNPVFIELGLRLGVAKTYDYFEKFGLLDRTGVDLPGEAGTIMHNQDNVGEVELATISFGQSFQITPLQLVTTASSVVNGGTRVTPHFGVEVRDEEGELIETLSYETRDGVVSEEVSEQMRYILEQVVEDGSGRNAHIAGFSIGGKTATSETLPRSENRYISSFVGFAPADDPQVIGVVIINNPQGLYYGGIVAAPVMQEIFNNVLPYLGIEKEYSEEELETMSEN